MSFILTYELLLHDLPFLNYLLSVNHYIHHSQPLLAKYCTNVIFYFMVRCGLFDWYINPVCLKQMIHIAEAEIGVLDSTGWARRKAGLIRALGYSHVFYASLVRSIIRCSLIGGIVALYNKQGTQVHKL
ncbi:unnamed protein product [Schistosoma curassoni]|uniref:Fatty acid hydroxylase domain-containing protein n=1 Tax=Schistosoma curassoni TaxID=6186 RepID=A0A183JZN6_9TREM|nr:unnamed protein product [Schistosoma curassoni]